MKKYNCWEFHNCDRGQGSIIRADVCPVAVETSAHGLNKGINGGRICWMIVASLKKNESTCCALQQYHSCIQCEFRHKVMIEEGLLNICTTTGLFLTTSSTHKKNGQSAR